MAGMANPLYNYLNGGVTGSGGGGGAEGGGPDPADQPGGWRYEQRRRDELADYGTKTGIDSGAAKSKTLYEQWLESSGAAPSNDMIASAKGEYDDAKHGFETAGFTPDQMQQIGAMQYEGATNAASTAQSNISQGLDARHLGGNAPLSTAIGLKGQFQGSQNRGNAIADLWGKQADYNLAGARGLADIAGNLSQIDLKPSYETISDRWQAGAPTGSGATTPISRRGF